MTELANCPSVEELADDEVELLNEDVDEVTLVRPAPLPPLELELEELDFPF